MRGLRCREAWFAISDIAWRQMIICNELNHRSDHHGSLGFHEVVDKRDAPRGVRMQISNRWI